MFSAIDQSGKTPSLCRSPATRATGAVDFARCGPCGPAAEVENGDEEIGLAMAREAREADDLALPGHDLAPVRLALRPDADPDRRRRRFRRPSPPARPHGHEPRRRPSRRRAWRDRNRPGRPAGHDLAVAHHDDAVGGREDLAEQMGDQHAAGAGVATMRRRKPNSWLAVWASSEEVGSSRMTIRSGVGGDRERRGRSRSSAACRSAGRPPPRRPRCRGRETSRRAWRRSARRHAAASRSRAGPDAGCGHSRPP